MPKIAFIGAGSFVFTRNLCNDILLAPALRGSTLALMDIDPGRLARARRGRGDRATTRGDRAGGGDDRAPRGDPRR